MAAEDYHQTAGRWKVVDDGGNKVFAQLALNSGRYVQHRAPRVEHVRNIDASVRLGKPWRVRTTEAAGSSGEPSAS